ncbi:ABC transporter permease [Archangium gephyra]|uniref:ABC transporter permease n=1 Tax=Archangium gephyra TaxID=48 RepID=UPI0035D4A1D3
MRRIALITLTFERARFLAALVGITFATTLALVQMGLYMGFLENASAIIQHIGGDAWVMARGTMVAEYGEPLSAGTRAFVESQPCVREVRGVVVTYVPVRKETGTLDLSTLVGYEPPDGSAVPWELVRGLPQALDAPLRVAIDDGDIAHYGIQGDPLRASLEVSGQTVYVSGLSHGIRPFSLTPYVLTSFSNAQRLVGLQQDQTYYWVVDLENPGCTASFMQRIEAHPELQARTMEGFTRITQDYWVGRAGAGIALAFNALLGVLVGIVIVGQTLYSLVKDHVRELATLKAVGASSRELVGFVAWQTLLLGVLGGSAGTALSLLVRELTSGLGLRVVLSPGVLVLGLGAMVLMCVIASLTSVRTLLRLDATEVFK